MRSYLRKANNLRIWSWRLGRRRWLASSTGSLRCWNRPSRWPNSDRMQRRRMGRAIRIWKTPKRGDNCECKTRGLTGRSVFVKLPWLGSRACPKMRDNWSHHPPNWLSFFFFFFWKEIRYLHWVAPSSAALSRSSARRRRKNRKHMALTSPLRDPPKFKNFRHTRDCWSSHWPGSCKIKLHVGCKQRPMRVASSRREADKCTCRKRCASFLKKKKTIFWSY